MKVICIKTEFYFNGALKGKVSILYGTVYNVIDVLDAESVTILNPPPPQYFLCSGNWYKLDGLDGHHHESNFIELPEELFKTNEIEKNENVQ
jgi:hypothetical protein